MAEAGYLTAEAAGDYMMCSPSKIKQWFRDGKLKGFKDGNKLLRFKREWLDEMAERQHKE